MSPKMLLLAVMTTAVMASAGGCDSLPGGVPTQVPTDLPDIEVPSDLPTRLPDVTLPELPTQLPTQLPGLPGGEEATDEGVAAPVPEATEAAEPSPEPSEVGIVDTATDAVEEVPRWVWLLLALAVGGLVAAIIALRKAKEAELAWAAQWHELTGEARWLDERVVPAVQDRALDPATLDTRWQDGIRRFDDLDRRIWAAANAETKPARTESLNALSDSLLRLRDALDTEVQLRTSGVEQPGLPDAAQTVADARDELRRTVTERTR